MYIIYHVIGIKVGCTSMELIYRLREQGYENHPYEVLETYENEVGDKFVGDREWEFADCYNLPRGVHYAVARLKRKNARIAAVESSNRPSKTGAWQRAGSKAALTSPNHNSKTGVLNKASTSSPNGTSKTGVLWRASVASPNHTSKKIITCSVCGFTCKGNLGIHSHKKNHKELKAELS